MRNQFSILAFKQTSTASISIKNVNMHENNTRNPYYVIEMSSTSFLLRKDFIIRDSTKLISLFWPFSLSKPLILAPNIDGLEPFNLLDLKNRAV